MITGFEKTIRIRVTFTGSESCATPPVIPQSRSFRAACVELAETTQDLFDMLAEEASTK